MGILDSIVSALGSSSTGPAGAVSSSAVVSEVLGMLRGQGGAANGLSSLLQASQATGMQPGDVAHHLSTVLPQIVDHLTPNGQIHGEDAAGALEGIAQRFLHR